jgi:hypothetical protein
MSRQGAINIEVRDPNRHHLVTCLEDRIEEVIRKIELADRCLDGALPKRRAADHDQVGRVGDGIPRRRRQGAWFAERSKQGRRVN